MISDVLSSAIEDIRRYLDDDAFPYGEHGTPLRNWIESVVTQMDALRTYLDAPPGDRHLLAPDEDPDAALAVITGQHKGSKAYAAICLAQAIQRGDYPAGWVRLDGSKP